MIEFDLQHRQGAFHLDARLQSDAHVIGLFGPSGAGKSTLLNILAGGITPDRGRIVIDGRCLLDTARRFDTPMHRRRIGIVYQEGRLFPHLSVRHNLAYGMHLVPVKERRFSLDEVATLLEIGALLDKSPSQLSGGERQRVALGRALLTSPALMLLDEPMASLDERLKAQILPFLRRVKEETSVPMIYVSHAISEVLALTQHLAVIQDGAILAAGEYHEVLASERVLPLAQTLGIENLLPVRIREHRAALGYSLGDSGGHALVLPLSEAPAGSMVTVVIPAANLSLARAPIAGITIQNQIAGRVTQVRMVDHRALVTLDIGSSLVVEVSAKSLHDLHIAPGQTLYCLMKTQSMRYLGR